MVNIDLITRTPAQKATLKPKSDDNGCCDNKSYFEDQSSTYVQSPGSPKRQQTYNDAHQDPDYDPADPNSCCDPEFYCCPSETPKRGLGVRRSFAGSLMWLLEARQQNTDQCQKKRDKDNGAVADPTIENEKPDTDEVNKLAGPAIEALKALKNLPLPLTFTIAVLLDPQIGLLPLIPLLAVPTAHEARDKIKAPFEELVNKAFIPLAAATDDDAQAACGKTTDALKDIMKQANMKYNLRPCGVAVIVPLSSTPSSSPSPTPAPTSTSPSSAPPVQSTAPPVGRDLEMAMLSFPMISVPDPKITCSNNHVSCSVLL